MRNIISSPQLTQKSTLQGWSTCVQLGMSPGALCTGHPQGQGSTIPAPHASLPAQPLHAGIPAQCSRAGETPLGR